MLSERKYLKLYQRQQESGLSVREFCSNEGIAYSTFYYWYKKTRPKRGNQEFIPLVVKPSPGVPAQDYVCLLFSGGISGKDAFDKYVGYK